MQLMDQATATFGSEPPSYPGRHGPFDRSLSSNSPYSGGHGPPNGRSVDQSLLVCNTLCFPLFVFGHLGFNLHLAIEFDLCYAFLSCRVTLFLDRVEDSTELCKPLGKC